MISTEKPGTPEELVHYGVKGMKWGVKRSRDSKRVSSSKQFKKDFPTRRARRDEIRRARASVAKADIDFQFAPNAQARRNAANVYLNNPDRVTARRLTAGEKAVAALLVGTGVAAAPVAAGVATNIAIRKGIERNQRRKSKK